MPFKKYGLTTIQSFGYRSTKINSYYVLFVAIFFVSFLLRIMPILNYNFPFTMDQGRDMIDIRAIVVGKDPTLIGPTTSINGVFLGPFWYYFNLPPFVLGAGNPAFLVYWMITWYQISAIILWKIASKIRPDLALFLSSLYLMSPTLFYQSRYSWSANPMPIMIVFFILLLILIKSSPSSKKVFALGIVSGLACQIEVALGVMLLPFSIVYMIVNKIHVRYAMFNFLAFTITLIPQIIFELKHNFLITTNFLNELTGKSNILSNKLTFEDAFYSHLKDFINSTHGVLQLSDKLNELLILISLLCLIYLYINKRLSTRPKDYFIISIYLIVFSFASYSFFLHNLKGWYLLGLTVPYLFIVATFFWKIYYKGPVIVNLTVILVMIVIFINSSITQIKLIPKGINDRSGDKSNLRNELAVVNWVYQRAHGQGFKVFSYLPSVYDFPYQYLFWWYGTKKYGYQPTEISYLENVPEYIKNNKLYLTSPKILESPYLIFLIIEKDNEIPKRQQVWLDNFSKYCLLENKKFYWETEIQVRANCKTQSLNEFIYPQTYDNFI